MFRVSRGFDVGVEQVPDRCGFVAVDVVDPLIGGGDRSELGVHDDIEDPVDVGGGGVTGCVAQ